LALPLRSLELYHFRNYPRFSLRFYSPFVLVLGENGVGKTNLLESIFFLSRLKGFRNERWVALKHRGTSEGYVKGEAPVGEMALVWDKEGLQRFFRGEKTRSSEWLGLFPVISHTPEDLLTMFQEGEARRRRLDALGTMVDPGYLAYLLRYHHALRQLKALLLYPRSQPEEVRVFSEILEETGKQLIERRKALLGALEEELRNFSRKGEISLRYLPSVPPFGEEILFTYKRGGFGREQGVRLSGPHRDDWELLWGGESWNSLSQGQKKHLLLQMTLAEGSVVRNSRGTPPLLLWDEVPQALDAKNLTSILSLLEALDLPAILTSIEPLPSLSRCGLWQIFTLRPPLGPNVPPSV
jgi:DNA replication and repair protein RecF